MGGVVLARMVIWDQFARSNTLAGGRVALARTTPRRAAAERSPWWFFIKHPRPKAGDALTLVYPVRAISPVKTC